MAGTNGFGAQTHFFVYLSRLLGRRVDLPEPHSAGRLIDLVAVEEPPYPKVSGLVVRARAGVIRVDMGGVTPGEFALGRRVNARKASAGPPREMMLLPSEFRVRSLLLDKQVVDVRGAKVVRVNDVQILADARGAFVVHVDVGLRGLLRRVGLEGAATALGRLFRRNGREDLVSWKYIHPVTAPPNGGGPLRLSVSQQALHDLHPGELADILEDLDRDGRLAVVQQMPAETAAEVLEEVDDTVGKSIVEDLSPEVAADIVEEMEPSEAVDLLSTLPEERAEQIMKHVEEDDAQDIRTLARYEEGTAGSLMSTDYIAVPPETTVQGAIDELRRQAGDVEAIYYVYVVAPLCRLIGVVSLRQLVTARPSAALQEIAEERLVTLHPETPVREVAQAFEKYGFLFLPVVEREAAQGPGKMLGVIGLQHALDQIRPHFGQEG
jgi:CBS domain-containing protein